MLYTFLTTAPATRRFSMEHPAWLYVLPLEDAASADISVLITYTDGSTAATAISLGPVVAFATRITNLAEAQQAYTAINPSKTIAKIEMSIGEAEGRDSLTLLPWYPSQVSDHIHALYYRNSLCGYDQLICTGDQVPSFSVQQQVAEVPITGESSITKEAQFVAVNQKGRRGATVSTGYMPRAELTALQDSFLVNDLREMILVDGDPVLLPCIIDQSTMQLSPARSNLHSLTFSYLYAWEDRALN